jgi:transaldolase
MKQSKIKSIRNFGQSIWLDFFNRNIMESGELKRLINNDGISGVTSNPSIFENAITGKADYDADIAVLSTKKLTNEEIFNILAVKDIQRAADFLKPTYENTKGNDGFVSLEVSPLLARDTDGTIQQARELWKAVDRKNVMIKIPATAEGLPAIRKCTSEGININITLLFELSRYKEVTDAYISGLEDRAKANESIDKINSVASFFLSRIDVLVDPLLDERRMYNLKGEVAIASAKKAYEMYKNIFGSERFKALEAKGAKRQHLLWASTSSKDPSYSDVKYVEALIGNETINTIPLKTIEAFNDHGRAASRLEDELDKATGVLAQLNDNGIDINTITRKLEEEGIEKFNKAYTKLLKAIEMQKKEWVKFAYSI